LLAPLSAGIPRAGGGGQRGGCREDGGSQRCPPGIRGGALAPHRPARYPSVSPVFGPSLFAIDTAPHLIPRFPPPSSNALFSPSPVRFLYAIRYDSCLPCCCIPYPNHAFDSIIYLSIYPSNSITGCGPVPASRLSTCPAFIYSPLIIALHKPNFPAEDTHGRAAVAQGGKLISPMKRHQHGHCRAGFRQAQLAT